MIVKICGIKTTEELDFVERYADLAGVVMDPSSKRFAGKRRAREIMNAASIPVFAVLTAESFDEAYNTACRINADNLQIHSEFFPVEDFERLKEHGFRVMKAFRVPERCDDHNAEVERIIRLINLYKPDHTLLDTGRGTGRVHDLRVSREVARMERVIIAGGLGPKNVRSVVEYVNPWGVDVSSGVERSGKKDESLIRAFVGEVRR